MNVLKALYQSVIAPEVRHRLGEYYTPDWLAERIVAHVVNDPLRQRVLDRPAGPARSCSTQFGGSSTPPQPAPSRSLKRFGA